VKSVILDRSKQEDVPGYIYNIARPNIPPESAIDDRYKIRWSSQPAEADRSANTWDFGGSAQKKWTT